MLAPMSSEGTSLRIDSAMAEEEGGRLAVEIEGGRWDGQEMGM